MKKLNTKILLFVLGLILIIPSVIYFFDQRMPTFNDETQIANIFEYNKAMSLGQFPPRWAPDMHFAYGTPFPEFNYQLPYYLTFIASRIGSPITVSFKALMVLSAFVAFAGFYLLGLEFASPQISLLAAIIYSYTPYRAVDLWVRGTLGESLAFAIFPFVLYFLFKLSKKQTPLNLIWSATSISLLVITHQIATIIVLPLMFVITLVQALFKKDIKSLIYQVGSGVLALFLSAFYWLPVLLEKRDLASVSPFNFYDHFPFIKQLIYSPWGYGGSVPGPADHMSFRLGWANLLFVAIAVGCVILYHRKKKAKETVRTILLILLTIAIPLFLMNIRSSFFWKIFPFTQEVQFPWRLLMATTLFTSLLVVFTLPLLRLPKKVINLFITCLVISVVALGMFHFTPGDLLTRDDNFYLRSFLPTQVLRPNETVSPLYLMHNEDYAVIPKDAHPPTTLPSQKITPILPDTKVTITDKNPFDLKAKVISPYPDRLTVNIFYFPGWLIEVDGQPADITLNYYGAMTFKVTGGRHDIEVIYQDSRVRQVSNIISLGTFLGLIVIIGDKLRRLKKKRG